MCHGAAVQLGPWLPFFEGVVGEKVFEFEGIRFRDFCVEARSIEVVLILGSESVGTVIEVDALDMVEDGGEGLEDVGFTATVASGEAVGVKLKAALVIPLTQEMHLEACGEAAEVRVQLEAQEFHVAGSKTSSLRPVTSLVSSFV